MTTKTKLFLAITMILTLSACSRETKEMTTEFSLPQEINHCSIHKMSNEGANRVDLYVVNCPNSTTTTTRGGKYPIRVSIHNETPNINENVESHVQPDIQQKLIPRPMTPEEYTEYYKRTYRQ